MENLETARLLLRPWQDGDAPVLYRWASAPEAGRAMLRRAFEDLGCTVVHCSHADFNSQSRRVIEKLGFTYRLTRNAVDVDGNSRPTCCYVLPREDWERQR